MPTADVASFDVAVPTGVCFGALTADVEQVSIAVSTALELWMYGSPVAVVSDRHGDQAPFTVWRRCQAALVAYANAVRSLERTSRDDSAGHLEALSFP